MSELLKGLAASSSGMAAQSTRLRLTAENLANRDTPGYRRKLVPFQQVFDADGSTVRAGRVTLSDAEFDRRFDPGHPLANPQGYVDGSNVNLMVELADAREAQRSYEANLHMLDQSRRMIAATLELLRR